MSEAEPVSKSKGKIPEDIATAAKDQQEEKENSALPLFSFFLDPENSKAIRGWGLRFQSNKKEAFCELIALIFELSGGKITVKPEHLDTVACDMLLSDFQDKVDEDQTTQKAPILNFIKNKKKNFVQKFWNDMAKQMISTLSLFDESYVNFRSFLTNICMCKIRILRISGIYAATSLYTQLTEQLNSTISELERFEKVASKTNAVQQKMETMKNEKRVYTLNATYFCNQIIAKSIRDNEPLIRSIAAEGIGNAACNFPSLFGDQAHLKYLEWALKASEPKQRASIMRILQKVFDELDPEQWKSLAEQIEDDIVKLCDDQENSTVDSAIRILLVMNQNQAILENENLDYVYALLADQTTSIRVIAAKFTVEHYFAGEHTPEEELKKFIEFSKKFNTDELSVVISSLFGKLKCLQDYDLLCDTMLVIDDVNAKQLAKIVLACAETGTGRLSVHSTTDIDINESRTETSVSLIKYLPRMITAFQTDPETQLPLIQAAHVLDLDAISENAADRLFPDLLAAIRDAFLSSNNKEVFDSASSVLYELSQGSHQLNEIARSELDKLAVGCGDISTGNKELAIPKFLSAARFVNMSDNSAIRDYLFECVNDENTALVRDSVECLMLFFQWDVLKIRKNPEECSSYEEMYNKLTSTFIEHLDSSDEEVRKAAIIALSSVYALQPIIKAEYAILSEDVIRQYCETFHTIKEKTPEFFDLAVRPIVWGTVPLKYAAHFLVYVCVDEMKASIQAAWQEIKKYAPIDGSEVNAALKKLEIAGMGTGQIALARKYISKKFRIEEVKEEETKKSDESDDEPKESFASH